ncbi:MAG: hypothetical protein P4L84_12265, partial [Isosphaeraceae bacterium]|nr:hypothetical protein [Isosphaeraceae bacterium]
AGGSISSRVDPSGSDEPKPKVEATTPAESKKNPGRLDSLEAKPEEKKEDLTPLSPPPSDNKPDSPPNPPAADREPAKKISEAPPAVPAAPVEGAKPGDLPLNLPPLEESTLRKARKPVFGSPTKLTENVLSGIVKSGDTGELVEGVPLRLTNRLRASADRALETDAYGRFAVRLPDGDWDVQVTMPSGRVYTVSRLNVSNGKIVDDQGRNIPSLIITR